MAYRLALCDVTPGKTFGKDGGDHETLSEAIKIGQDAMHSHPGSPYGVCGFYVYDLSRNTNWGGVLVERIGNFPPNW